MSVQCNQTQILSSERRTCTEDILIFGENIIRIVCDDYCAILTLRLWMPEISIGRGKCCEKEAVCFTLSEAAAWICRWHCLSGHFTPYWNTQNMAQILIVRWLFFSWGPSLSWCLWLLFACLSENFHLSNTLQSDTTKTHISLSSTVLGNVRKLTHWTWWTCYMSLWACY